MERQRSLLLVEDEDGLRRLVFEFLQAEGFRVVEAADGPAAVERFEDSGPYDLALLDLNLPGFSGVEVCRRIRASNPAQPILICSAAVMPEVEGDLKTLQVHQFLSKPFHPETLLARIAASLATEHPRPHPAAGTFPRPHRSGPHAPVICPTMRDSD